MVTALADTLRRAGGCPGLGAIAEAAERGRAATAVTDVQLAGQVALRKVRGMPAQQHVQAALDSARSLVSTGDLDGLRGEQVQRRVAMSFLERLIRANLLDRITPKLMQQPGRSLDDLVPYMDHCIDQADLQALADRLLAHEDGRGLRAPSRRGPRRSTRELLNTPMGQVG